MLWHELRADCSRESVELLQSADGAGCGDHSSARDTSPRLARNDAGGCDDDRDFARAKPRRHL